MLTEVHAKKSSEYTYYIYKNRFMGLQTEKMYTVLNEIT